MISTFIVGQRRHDAPLVHAAGGTCAQTDRAVGDAGVGIAASVVSPDGGLSAASDVNRPETRPDAIG